MIRRSLALLALPTLLVAQSRFEGVVTMQFQSPQGPMEVNYMVKGDQMRMDVPMMAPAYILRDGTKNTSAMVLPGQRMVMEMPSMPAGAEARAGNAGPAPDVKMTGKKETIAGFECEHITVTPQNGAAYDVCA